MTEDKVRFHAQRALMALEWLDQHVAPRRPADAKALANTVELLRKELYKLVGTNSAADQSRETLQ